MESLLTQNTLRDTLSGGDTGSAQGLLISRVSHSEPEAGKNHSETLPSSPPWSGSSSFTAHLHLLPTWLWRNGMTAQEEAGRCGLLKRGRRKGMKEAMGGIRMGPQRTIFPHRPQEGCLHRCWEGLWTPSVQQKHNVSCYIISNFSVAALKKVGKKQVKVVLIIYLAK